MNHVQEQLDGTDHDESDIAALANGLYGSDAFEADLRAAVRDVLRDHVVESDTVDVDELDFDAEYALEDQLFKNGRGGLFMARGKLVTNAEADLAAGDIVRMVSAQDEDKIITYVVKRAEADGTSASAERVDVEKEQVRHKMGGLTPGHVLYDDRYEVDRSRRDDDERPHSIARDLLDELLDDDDAGLEVTADV